MNNNEKFATKSLTHFAEEPKILIYFADLVHNYLGAGTYMFPLNIGYVSSYAKKEFGDRIQIELFKYPNELFSAIKKRPPHILALSNYNWNSHLNHKVTEFSKKNNADLVIICGGPDINLNSEGYKAFFETHPYVDFYVLCEGEIAFSNIIRQFLNNNCTLSETKKQSIEGCVINNSGNIIIGKILERIGNVDTIPSPYLTGVLDKFFSYKLIPIIETNRGCPFSCVFCSQGMTSHHIVKYFNIERVFDELDYIAERVKNVATLSIADANFGIHPRDVKISKKIHELRDTKGYPRRCSLNWIKNKQALNVAEAMGEASIPLISSLQSLDTEVLTIIKRQNVDQTHFLDVINHINNQGGVSATEIIVGLPGETRESHVQALRTLFDWNVSYIICYNCIILNGTEMNSTEFLENYNIKTKFRLGDSAFGKYEDFFSFECEEGVRSTSTMTEKEIVYFRSVHWLIQFLWNYRVHYLILRYCQTKGINPYDFIISIIDSAGKAPKPVRDIFRDFSEEAEYKEWFETPEDLRSYYTKNFNLLESGEIGKMNFKYMWRVILECKPQFDEYIKQIALNLFPKDEDLIEDLISFSSHHLIDFNSEIDHINPKNIYLKYDIVQWQNQGYSTKIPRSNIHYKFYLPDEKRKSLKILLKQYAHENRNLTMRKMSELANLNDLFFNVIHN